MCLYWSGQRPCFPLLLRLYFDLNSLLCLPCWTLLITATLIRYPWCHSFTLLHASHPLGDCTIWKTQSLEHLKGITKKLEKQIHTRWWETENSTSQPNFYSQLGRRTSPTQRENTLTPVNSPCSSDAISRFDDCYHEFSAATNALLIRLPSKEVMDCWTEGRIQFEALWCLKKAKKHVQNFFLSYIFYSFDPFS